METLSARQVALRNTVVAIGSFDGIHLGHQAILQMLVGEARRIAARSVVLTFGDHPRRVARGEEIPLITCPEERAEILEGLGVDYLVVLDNPRIFACPAEQFVQRFIREKIDARQVLAGFNFRFGRDRLGDRALLEEQGAILGFKVTVLNPVRVGREVVSSSSIRQYLRQGRVAEAALLLGRPYQARGRVVAGRGKGRKLGFPTANIVPDIPTLAAPGVYAVTVNLPEQGRGGRELPAAAFLGAGDVRKNTQPLLEVHIPGFNGNLYEERLQVGFVKKVRDRQKFTDDQKLAEAIRQDIRQILDSENSHRTEAVNG